jgi:hypothetical protein
MPVRADLPADVRRDTLTWNPPMQEVAAVGSFSCKLERW